MVSMNPPPILDYEQSEGGSVQPNPPATPLINNVVAAAMMGVCGFLGVQVYAEGNDISGMKVQIAANANDERRTENAVGQINGALTTILGSLQGLKDNSLVQTEQLTDLRKHIDEIDLILRPFGGPHK